MKLSVSVRVFGHKRNVEVDVRDYNWNTIERAVASKLGVERREVHVFNAVPTKED